MIEENNYMKEYVEKKQKIDRADFVLDLFLGVKLPKDHPRYNENRTSVEIYSYDCNTPSQFEVNINGKEYNDRKDLFSKIKLIVEENLNQLIEISKSQTNDNIMNNSVEGGSCSIAIKYGQLLVNINGQVSNNRNETFNFINKIINLFQENIGN